MKASPNKPTTTNNGSFWHPDAVERLHLLLPELVLSIIATTCLTIVVGYGDDTNAVAAVVVMGIAQILTQALLYVCTYLAAKATATLLAWMLIVLLMVSYDMLLSFIGVSSVYPDAEFAASLGVILGPILFYLTRIRVGFVTLALEMIFLAEEISQQTGALAFHAVGTAALAALFVMRSSATRITMHDPPVQRIGNDNNEGRNSLGASGQIAALATAAAALCLTLSLAGTAIFVRWSAAASTATGSQTESTEDGQTVTTSSPVTDAGVGGQDGELDLGGSDSSVHVENDPSTTVESTNDTQSKPHDTVFHWPLFLLLLLLMAVSPFPIRLLLREHTKRAIQSEKRETDRVAGIYVGIISRLESAGIVRDEAETPREFLARREQDLEELTAPVGLGLTEWTTLTDIHERARYAGLNPTEEELETCWALYDALPICIRTKIGWQRYLTSAFWKM